MAAIVAAVGWLLGLRFAGDLPHLDPIPALLIALGVGGLGLLWRTVLLARLSAIALVLVLGGTLRAQAVVPEVGFGTVSEWAGRGSLELRGRIADQATPLDRGMRLVVAVEEVRWRNRVESTRGRLQAAVPPGDWRYGDAVALVGEVEQPVNGDAAPMADVLARQGIWATMRGVDARRLDRPPPEGPLELLRTDLYDLKAATAAGLDRHLPSPSSALARGLLLGEGSALPSDVAEGFRGAGMTHVVAVSGYNIALVAGAMLPLGALYRRRGGLGLPALAILAFTLAVGAPPSAVRAALMGCLALLARQVGRPADATAGLAVAALAMTAYDPSLLGDLGFQLSSLATLALVTVYPWIEERMGGRATLLREGLAATLAVELLTLPLTAVEFGRVALLSPIANLLALPVVPAAMLASLPVALAGLLPLPDALAAPLGWLAWVPLAWILAVVELCAAPGWSSLPVGRLAPELVWLYYAVAALWLLSLHGRAYGLAAPSPAALASRALARVPAPIAVGLAALAAVAAWAAALQMPSPGTRLTFFEESGAALLRTDGGRALIVEPGARGRALGADVGRVLPFWQSAVDVALVTHDAPDAVDALPELLRRQRIGQIGAPAGVEPRANRPATSSRGTEPTPGRPDVRWREAAAAAGVPVVPPLDGALVDVGGGATLETLADGGAASYLLTVGETRVLLLGALDRATQRGLAELVAAPVEVLWLSGDADGLDPALRERADPRVVVLHVRSGFPKPGAPRTDDRFRVVRTDDHGTVELLLGPAGYELRSRREPH